MSDSTSIASNEVANEINKDKEYRLNSLIKQQQQSKSNKQQKEAGLPKDLGSRVSIPNIPTVVHSVWVRH
jgi:hypothetical protein